jgi:queuine tRNA-ribosyltransferase
VAMLAAGFYVAKGRSTGDKEATTIAFTPPALSTVFAQGHDLLASEWLAKWNRSGAKYPAEIPREQHAAFAESIRSHPQFQGLSPRA